MISHSVRPGGGRGEGGGGIITRDDDPPLQDFDLKYEFLFFYCSYVTGHISVVAVEITVYVIS